MPADGRGQSTAGRDCPRCTAVGACGSIQQLHRSVKDSPAVPVILTSTLLPAALAALLFLEQNTRLHLSPPIVYMVSKTIQLPKQTHASTARTTVPGLHDLQGLGFAMISKMNQRHHSSFPNLKATLNKVTLTIYSTGQLRTGGFRNTALHNKHFVFSSQTKLLSDARYCRTRQQMLETSDALGVPC